LINAGKEPREILNILESQSQHLGYDVKNEKMGDLYEMGVIDPLKVTKNALLNAVSVATTILSTNAIVTHARVNINN
jgi:chaperonin GroEL